MRLQFLLSLFFLALVSAELIPLVADEKCKYTYQNSSTTLYYDLTPLTKDYTIQNPSDAYYTFKINPCGALTSIPSGNAICPITGATPSYGCQVSKSNQDPAFLVANKIKSLVVDSTSQKLVLTLDGGALCPGNGNYREAVITFTCGTTEQNPVYVSESLCSYKFTWTTPSACASESKPPKSGGLSAGSILCIVFFCSLFVYIAAGMAFKYKYREARGAEMVPNVDFWRGLPSLCKDGFTFTVDKIKQCMGKS